MKTEEVIDNWFENKDSIRFDAETIIGKGRIKTAIYFIDKVDERNDGYHYRMYSHGIDKFKKPFQYYYNKYHNKMAKNEEEIRQRRSDFAKMYRDVDPDLADLMSSIIKLTENRKYAINIAIEVGKDEL